MQDQPFNIALVDDHYLVREGVRAMLANWSRGRVVLEAEDGLDYERRVASAPPIHLAIVDLMMPGRDGFATTAWIREHHRYTRVLGLSFDPRCWDEERIIKAGGYGLVAKTIKPLDLYAVCNHVLDHGYYRNPLLKRPTRPVPQLTPREQELLEHLCHPVERTLAELAPIIGCAVNTLRNHRDNLYAKLNVSGHTELIHAAVQFGLLSCPCGGAKGYTEPEGVREGIEGVNEAICQSERGWGSPLLMFEE